LAHLQVLPDTGNEGPHGRERFFLEIRNRHKWLLDNTGERVLLYQRKYVVTPNQPRSSDWDNVRKRARQHGQDPVASGYGTGIEGGYFKPIEIMVRVVSNQQQVIVEDVGRKFHYLPRSWTLWEPLLNNGDFIVRRNNQRLRITDVTQHRWKHYVLHQDFNLTFIEPDSPIYKIPVDL